MPDQLLFLARFFYRWVIFTWFCRIYLPPSATVRVSPRNFVIVVVV